LEEALGGVHGAIVDRLMAQLKDLRSARDLLAFIEAQDWSAIDADTRLVALHEINTAITKFRERNGLAPIDDALPGERPNAFLIKQQLFPREREASPGAVSPVHET
jgi:hypothetical protein